MGSVTLFTGLRTRLGSGITLHVLYATAPETATAVTFHPLGSVTLFAGLRTRLGSRITLRVLAVTFDEKRNMSPKQVDPLQKKLGS